MNTLKSNGSKWRECRGLITNSSWNLGTERSSYGDGLSMGSVRYDSVTYAEISVS